MKMSAIELDFMKQKISTILLAKNIQTETVSAIPSKKQRIVSIFDNSDDEDEAGTLTSAEIISLEVNRYENIMIFDNRYCCIPSVEQNGDLVNWWCTNRSTFPNLFNLATEILAIPASSVPSERANSIAKIIYEGREMLDDELFKAEICSKSWVGLFEKLNLPLPMDFDLTFRDLKLSDQALLDMAKDDTMIDYFCRTELEIKD